MSKHKGGLPVMDIEKHCVGVMKRGGPETTETTETKMKTPIGLIGEAIMLACERGGNSWKVKELIRQAIELEGDKKAFSVAHVATSRLVRRLGDERAAKVIYLVEDYFDGITSDKRLTSMLNRMVVTDESQIAGG